MKSIHRTVRTRLMRWTSSEVRTLHVLPVLEASMVLLVLVRIEGRLMLLILRCVERLLLLPRRTSSLVGAWWWFVRCHRCKMWTWILTMRRCFGRRRRCKTWTLYDVRRTAARESRVVCEACPPSVWPMIPSDLAIEEVQWIGTASIYQDHPEDPLSTAQL
jgi:hypothetical protein